MYVGLPERYAAPLDAVRCRRHRQGRAGGQRRGEEALAAAGGLRCGDLAEGDGVGRHHRIGEVARVGDAGDGARLQGPEVGDDQAGAVLRVGRAVGEGSVVRADLGLGDLGESGRDGPVAGGEVVAEEPDLRVGSVRPDVLDQRPVVVDHDGGLRDEPSRRGVPDHDVLAGPAHVQAAHLGGSELPPCCCGHWVSRWACDDSDCRYACDHSTCLWQQCGEALPPEPPPAGN